MANTIKVKRSATQSAIPTTGQLELGELAINTYDGKLFIKKDNGTASVVEIGAGSGTVTSVGFTGGLISVATATTTPALTVAGTSGGIPYFTSTSTWATSALLTASALMLGGGAGASPTTTTTGSGVVTALGVNTESAGAVVLFNGALGTPTSGTMTNVSGTASSLTAGNVTTNANLTGDITSVGNATTLTNAPVIAKVLTGYTSGAGTVSATDSILQAIQKLNGNTSALVVEPAYFLATMMG